MRAYALLLLLAAFLVAVFAEEVQLDKKERFSHAEVYYPAGKYSSLNAVSSAHVLTRVRICGSSSRPRPPRTISPYT